MSDEAKALWKEAGTNLLYGTVSAIVVALFAAFFIFITSFAAIKTIFILSLVLMFVVAFLCFFGLIVRITVFDEKL